MNANLHTEDSFCYVDTVHSSTTSAYQYNLRGSNCKDLRLLRGSLLRLRRETHRRC